MNYEKVYKEALERAKSMMALPDDKATMEYIFPELAESEDERIRREIIDFIQWAEDRGMTRHDYHQAKRPAVWIAYLKKQKELFESGKGLYYYDGEKTTYCGYLATEENPYDFAMCQQEKQKEQKPADDKSFEDWIDGWYNEHHRDGYITMDEREFKNWSRGIRNMYQQKPAEWSKEDEEMLKNIEYALHKEIVYSTAPYGLPSGTGTATYKYHKEIDWLKSLRSSWKPSEEQMDALNSLLCIGDFSYVGQHSQLQGLYNELKKL